MIIPIIGKKRTYCPFADKNIIISEAMFNSSGDFTFTALDIIKKLYVENKKMNKPKYQGILLGKMIMERP